MINVGDYVKVIKIEGEYSEYYDHAIGRVYEVEIIVDDEHIYPLKYGLYIEGEGLSYFSDDEVELIK